MEAQGQHWNLDCNSSARRNFYVLHAAVFLNVRIVVITEMEISHNVPRELLLE